MAACSNFVLEGLPVNGVLGQKLWLVSKTLSKSPFSEEIQGLTIPQLDWIIEMIAKDHPDRIRISRGGEEALPDGARASLESAALWDSKRGRAKAAMVDRLFNPQQLAKIKSHARKRGPTLYTAPGVALPK